MPKSRITRSQKRVVYIVMVMILLVVFAVLIYLIFVLVTFQGMLVEMDDKTTILVGSIITILAGMFGVPVGKKWWQVVYEERERGAFLSVKK